MLSKLNIWDYIAFALYFVFILSTALWVSRKPRDRDRNTEDYFLAGRALPWWIIGASLIASNISTEQIIGMNGTAFESGIAIISYSLIGAAITILIVARFFLPIFLKMKIYSMPEFLEKRFDKRVSISMSFFWILVYIFVNLTSVLSLGAITLHSVLGIPIIYSIIGLALLSGIYTIYGGLPAVAWTDFIQVGVLIVGGLVVVWLGLDKIAMNHNDAGIIEGFSILMDSKPDKFHTVLPASHNEIPWTGVFLGGLWIAALSYWGCNQYIIQRALAAKNLNEAQKGLLFASLLSIIVAIIIVFPGVIASDLYADKITSRDQAFPVLIKELLPPGYSGLVIAALIAAIISSLNSMCNSVATIFTLDVYKNIFRKTASQKELVLVGRITAAGALIIAIIVAPVVAEMGRLFAFIQEYTGFVTPGVLVIFLAGLFWKKTNGTAALSAVLLTIPVSLVMKICLPQIAFLNRMALTFLILFLITVILSLTHKKNPDLEMNSRFKDHKSSLIFNMGSIAIVMIISLFYIVFW